MGKYGADVAKDIYRFEWDNYKAIHEFIDRYSSNYPTSTPMPISVAYEKGGIQLYESLQDFQYAVNDVRIAKEHGLDIGLEIWTASDVESRLRATPGKWAGGIRNPTCDAFWPAGFINLVAKVAMNEYGLDIRTHSPVVSVLSEASITPSCPHPLLIVNGMRKDGAAFSVKARHVLHCTNAYVSNIVKSLEEVVIPVRNQLIAVKKVGNTTQKWNIAMSARHGHAYWSKRYDGTVVLGGLREYTPNHQVNFWLINAKKVDGQRCGGCLGPRYSNQPSPLFAGVISRFGLTRW